MTPAAILRGGAPFATRRRAGFFCVAPGTSERIDGNGKHLDSVRALDGAGAAEEGRRRRHEPATSPARSGELRRCAQQGEPGA